MTERFVLRPSVTIVDGKLVYDQSPDLVKRNLESQSRIEAQKGQELPQSRFRTSGFVRPFDRTKGLK